MFHLNDDKHLDQASKLAADNYEAPSSPNWEGLQSRLDKELPVKKEKRRRWFLFLFLLAGLTTSGAFLWYTNHSNTKNTLVSAVPANKQSVAVINQPQVKSTVPPVSLNQEGKIESPKNSGIQLLTATENKEKNIEASTKKINKESGTGKSNLKQSFENNQQPTDISLPDKVIATSNFKKNRRKELAVIAPGDFESSVKTKKNNSTSLKIKKATDNGSNPAPDIFNAGKEDGDNESGTSQEAIARKNDAVTDSVALTKNITGENTPRQFATPSSDTLKKTATITKKNKSIPKQAFSVALVAGTDISTVKFKYGNKPGIHGGIIAGYHFGGKWSLHTGAIYTQNNYKLKGADYHPPKHYWTQYVKLETVEGYCRMWEIPILLRYQFNPKASNRLFISGGLSTYLMKKQQYDYFYKTNAGVPVKRSWQTDSTSKYMFSILDLSAGWEKSLTKRLNVQVEPYAKIPLKGVGFGSIRLSSFGINFSIQLRQPIKR